MAGRSALGVPYFLFCYEEYMSVSVQLSNIDRAIYIALLVMMARRRGLVPDVAAHVARNTGCTWQQWIATKHRLFQAHVVALVQDGDRAFIDLGDAVPEQRRALSRLPKAGRPKLGRFREWPDG